MGHWKKTTDLSTIYHGKNSVLEWLEEFCKVNGFTTRAQECGELIQQAAKCYDKGEAYSDEFAEELADVTVLTMQFEGFFNVYQRQRYRDCVREKLDRQIRRIESEEGNDIP